MKNKIEDLRNHLFVAIEQLMDKENPMPLDRAQTVADVAQVIVNSAKVEVDFLRAADALGANLDKGVTVGTGFINSKKPELKAIK